MDNFDTVKSIFELENIFWDTHKSPPIFYESGLEVLVGTPEEKKPLGRLRRRCEDNIKMDHQEVGCGGMDWIELAQDREKWQGLMNAVMNLRVP